MNTSYSLDFVFTNIMQIQFPYSESRIFFLGSCNGILCFVSKGAEDLLLRLWNPSIQKFKELPPFISKPYKYPWMYGFGYDPISDNYKVVVVIHQYHLENEVKVHTLGTDSWKNVLQFPFATSFVKRRGQHVSGTINWLLFTGIKRFIASFDLRNECYQKVLLPDNYGKVDQNKLWLSVFRDCLCMSFGEDFWVMKEYGNKESWTKLFTISYMQYSRASSYCYSYPIWVFEDEQVLLVYGDTARSGCISYNRKNDTSKFIEFESLPEICVESLISPCF